MSEALTTVLPGGASVVDEARDESDALLQRIPELDERDAVARTLASVADAVDLDLIVEPKRRAFLAAFAVGGNIAQACVAAKCARASVRGWREHDEAFDRCFFAAKECAADLLEAEAPAGARSPVATSPAQNSRGPRRLPTASCKKLFLEGAEDYSTRRSCDGAMRGGEGESSSAPLTVESSPFLVETVYGS